MGGLAVSCHRGLQCDSGIPVWQIDTCHIGWQSVSWSLDTFYGEYDLHSSGKSFWVIGLQPRASIWHLYQRWASSEKIKELASGHTSKLRSWPWASIHATASEPSQFDDRLTVGVYRWTVESSPCLWIQWILWIYYALFCVVFFPDI